MCGTRSRARPALATEAPALLLVGHGSRLHGAGGALERNTARLRADPRFSAVALGWLRGEPSVEEALAQLTVRRVVVVPLLMGDGPLVRKELPSRLAGAERELHLCPPLGLAPGLARRLRDRALAACENAGLIAADTTVLLVGHGSSADPASALATRAQAGRLAALGPFRDVMPVFLDEEPTLAAALPAADGPIVVVGFFALAGRHAAIDVPALVAQHGGRGRCVYAGTIGDDPALTNIVLDQAAAVAWSCAAAT